MTKYGQYCPVARAAEILGDRWTLLILRDMLVGVQHFNELERGLPGIPKALLAERLRRLQKAGLVVRHAEPHGRKVRYTLTQAGEELRPLLHMLIHWGAKWAFGEPDEEERNPLLLMRWIHRCLRTDRLPDQRIVVEFEFVGERQGPFWLVLEPGDPSVCLTYPGFEVDVRVRAGISAMLQVWLGRMEYFDALRAGLIEVVAPPSLARAFPRWFSLSPTAPTVRAVTRAAQTQA
jgi:DNA-binding HxlR family transcriptional regulator